MHVVMAHSATTVPFAATRFRTSAECLLAMPAGRIAEPEALRWRNHDSSVVADDVRFRAAAKPTSTADIRRKAAVLKSLSLLHTPDKGAELEPRPQRLIREPPSATRPPSYRRSGQILDRALEGLLGLADDLLVCGDGTLGSHAQGVGLKRHVRGELSLARRRVEADRSIDFFVPVVAGGLPTAASYKPHRHNP